MGSRKIATVRSVRSDLACNLGTSTKSIKTSRGEAPNSSFRATKYGSNVDIRH